MTLNFRIKKIRNQKGLTLVELLLSVVILSVGLVAVVRALLSSVDALSYIDSRMEARRLVAKKVWDIQDEMAHSGSITQPGQGTIDGARKKYPCQFESKASSFPNLVEAALKVTLSEGGRSKIFSRSFYLLGPGKTNPAESSSTQGIV